MDNFNCYTLFSFLNPRLSTKLNEIFCPELCVHSGVRKFNFMLHTKTLNGLNKQAGNFCGFINVNICLCLLYLGYIESFEKTV